MGLQQPHPIHTPTTTPPAQIIFPPQTSPTDQNTKPSPPLPPCQATKHSTNIHTNSKKPQGEEPAMAGVNSSVAGLKPAAAVPAAASPAKRVQVAPKADGRRAALLGLAAVFAATAATGSAKAGVIDEYLEKSKANKELNDKKRLATSGANFARAYTVEFGSCQFPYNFTGCQDLAKQKKVPFISDDLEIECEGKEKYKCGSNVFWKW
ncbi:hypothetical protein ACP4OV_003794 [Aristida adscensionis]